MKKTKIIATIGPASSDYEIIKEMVLNGCDVIRLNLSHVNHKFCDDIIEKVRKLEKELKVPIGIMLDTNGPSVRLHEIKEGKVLLSEGKEIKVYEYPVLCNNSQISVNYPDVLKDLKIGDVLVLSDGDVLIEVSEIHNDFVVCKIIKEGYIYSKQAIHLQNGTFNIPFMNDDDKEDILYAITKNIDYLALSFVRSEQDVLEVADLLIQNENNHLEIISKIENLDAFENVEEIAKVSDGLMVARGDLALEASLEKLPFYQRKIIDCANNFEKTCIVATDFLMSMENSLTPARSEITDVYSAVMDKTDAIMLSGETTVGKYPVEAVSTMAKIILSAEEDFDYSDNLANTLRNTKQDVTSSIAYSVVDSSIRLNSKVIVANTNSGYTAKKISYFHPACPILGLSPNLDTVHSLTLCYGVYPRLTEECKSTDTIVKMCTNKAISEMELENNDTVIVTGGFPISSKNTNFMKIEVINKE